MGRKLAGSAACPDFLGTGTTTDPRSACGKYPVATMVLINRVTKGANCACPALKASVEMVLVIAFPDANRCSSLSMWSTLACRSIVDGGVC
eukprot:6456030-Amphidinium_carterae.5